MRELPMTDNATMDRYREERKGENVQRIQENIEKAKKDEAKKSEKKD